jgi:hypothetical protein
MAGSTHRLPGTTPRQPEQFRAHENIDFVVSELVSDAAGAHAPWGDIEFPIPVSAIDYKHPGPENRPHLAEGR